MQSEAFFDDRETVPEVLELALEIGVGKANHCLCLTKLAGGFFPESPELFVDSRHSLCHKLNLAVDSFNQNSNVTLDLLESLVQVRDQLLVHGWSSVSGDRAVVLSSSVT